VQLLAHSWRWRLPEAVLKGPAASLLTGLRSYFPGGAALARRVALMKLLRTLNNKFLIDNANCVNYCFDHHIFPIETNPQIDSSNRLYFRKL
jgi:hypothetical protein